MRVVCSVWQSNVAILTDLRDGVESFRPFYYYIIPNPFTPSSALSGFHLQQQKIHQRNALR
eukprot:gene9961-6954_t